MEAQFSSVQSLSHVQLFATPWIATRQASLSISNYQGSLRLTSIESVMPSSHLILGRPLLLLPPIPPSIRVFSNESTLHMRWPKYWTFSFSIIPSREIPGLISFRMDWLDLLAVQGTLKSLLQYHSSKASILWRSAFFTVQLSHPYMTAGKTIALTRQTLVGKVMSLLLNMLSRLVITTQIIRLIGTIESQLEIFILFIKVGGDNWMSIYSAKMNKIPLLGSGMCCRRVSWRPSFLWQCWVVLVPQLCPSLWDPTNCSPPGSSVHEILQARILKWVVIPFSRTSSRPRDQTRVSRVGGRRFNLWATKFLCVLYS